MHHRAYSPNHYRTHLHQIRNRNQHQTFSISYPISSAASALFHPRTHHSHLASIHHFLFLCINSLSLFSILYSIIFNLSKSTLLYLHQCQSRSRIRCIPLFASVIHSSICTCIHDQIHCISFLSNSLASASAPSNCIQQQPLASVSICIS